MKRTKHAASSTKAEDTSHRRNRRQALALGGAAAAAAAVAALAMDGGKKAQAATGQSMIVGHGNQSDPGDWTGLSGNVGGNVPGEVAVLDITNLSHERGDGLHVRARGGFQAEGPSAAIWARAENWDGTGLGNGHGVMSFTAAGVGVYGIATEEGTGHPTGPVGVRGRAPGTSPGVQAISGTGVWSDGGLALDVMGKARFSTAGAGVFAARANAVAVSDPAVTPDSHITVTFTGDPGNAAAVVQWVERQPASGFIVHLRVPVFNETPFTYLIVEPGA